MADEPKVVSEEEQITPEAEAAEPEAPANEAVAEPSTAEVEQETEEQPEETVEEPEQPTEAPMSRRKAQRLEKLESLVERLKGDDKPAPALKPTGMDYRTTLDADDATINQLEADRQAATQASFQQGIEQAKSIQFHTRLEIDAPRVESKYPIFNKDSAEFNPAAANAINRWYLTSVGYDASTDTVQNPGVRYNEFVEGVMELANSMAGAKVENTQKNIAKQAASTGLRPDGTAAKLNLNKPPEAMTEDELKAVLKQAGL